MASGDARGAGLHSGTVLLAGLAGVLLGYFHALPALIGTWLSSPEFGHGLLIPFVIAYILWDTRDQIFDRSFSPSWLGVVLLIAAQSLVIVAVLADLEKAKAYALVLAIVSLVFAVAGTAIARRCTFPLLLLLLAVPLPYLIGKLLTIRMQLISSDLGVAIIRLMGLPVLQEGNVISMGHFQMLVAEACAGLRYMFPLVSVGLILAYFLKAPFWAKALVVAITVPITLFMNSFRIAATGLLISKFGSEAAEGFLHAFEGWVVFVFAIALLLLCIWLISKLLPGSRRFTDNFYLASGDKPTFFEKWRRLPMPVAAFFSVLLAGSALSAYAHLRFSPVLPPRENFEQFPLVIDGKGLHRGALAADVLEVLKADDYFIGDYAGGDGQPPINLYMAYYAAQRDGAVVHSPKDCLPAGGWSIDSIDKVDLPNLSGQGNRALISKGRERLLVYYWVHQQGHNYADEMKARAALLRDSITKQRTDASLIRVIVPVGESLESSEKVLHQFVASLASNLPRFVPQ